MKTAVTCFVMCPLSLAPNGPASDETCIRRSCSRVRERRTKTIQRPSRS